jgi:hypothetical protein
MTSRITDDALSRVLRLVAVLNLAYFGIEFAVARTIGSVSLFADSIDFLEAASVNFLILIAFGSTARERARVGMALAGILLVPGLAMLWTACNWLRVNRHLGLEQLRSQPGQPPSVRIMGLSRHLGDHAALARAESTSEIRSNRCPTPAPSVPL